MKIRSEQSGDVFIVRLKGNLMGGPDADEIRGAVVTAIEEGQRKVLVDLKDVPWINSTGLGILISCLASAQNRGATLKVARLSDRVSSLFITTRLNVAFELYTTEEEALASFAG